jgi:4-hydroxybenzoate polyprenyltransferase
MKLQTDQTSSVTHHKLALKVIALFSVVRWYNILLTILAQYISAFVFIRHSHGSYAHILTDFKLHGIVLASIFSIAAGFIINNFYDFEKDLINRPKNTLFNRIISKKTSLNLYIAFNLLALLIAYLSSFKIGVFFTAFVLALWIYSHKLQKIFFIKEFAAAMLSITCFFAVLLHFNTFYTFIFIYGAYFLSIVYARELIKQFLNYTGDKILQIQSIPVVLGMQNAKSFIYFVMVLSLLLGAGIIAYEGLITKNYFVLLSSVVTVVSFGLIEKTRYKAVHTIFKIVIVLGIFNLLTFLF